MKTLELIPFYKYQEGIHIHCSSDLNEGKLNFQFKMTGDVTAVKVPDVSQFPAKIDGLYRTTCFEIFVANEKGAYLEWNFSPSGDWCVFPFDSYRNKGTDLVGKESFFLKVFQTKAQELLLTVSLDFSLVKKLLKIKNKAKVNCTAVIEFQSGKLDYYALAHPKEKPDFHDLKGFLIDW